MHEKSKRVGLDVVESQDVIRPIPCSYHWLCWGDWEMGLLSYAQNAVKWPALSI